MKKLHAGGRLAAIGAVPMAGFALLYLVPLGMTFRYAMVQSSFECTIVGLDNFRHVWSNSFFLLGLRNLLGISLLCLTGAALLATALSWLLGEHPRLSGIGMAVLILPLLIPSVAAVTLWDFVFGTDILTPVPISMLALLSLYWWKCSGPAGVLMYIALTALPQEVLDAAAMDGCGKGRLFFRIRLPMIRNSIVLALLFLLMYCFRIYKESYLLFGQYPANALYLVQHYMNNHYLKTSVQYVSAAAASLVLLCILFFGSAALLRERRPAL